MENFGFQFIHRLSDLISQSITASLTFVCSFSARNLSRGSAITHGVPQKVSNSQVCKSVSFILSSILFGFISRLDTENKSTKMHLSDLMRYALLYKYGGFYFDRDVLTLKTLVNYKNVVAIEYPQRFVALLFLLARAGTVEKNQILKGISA